MIPHCALCGHEHHADEPHNRYSIYFQMNFYQQHGRWPNWADAMAHCDHETRQAWTEGLLGKRVQPGEFVSMGEEGGSAIRNAVQFIRSQKEGKEHYDSARVYYERALEEIGTRRLMQALS